MRLVIDTNIVFSLFKSNSFTIRLLKENKIELFAPKEVFDEIIKYCNLVCSKSKISKEKFLENVKLLPELIDFRDASNLFKQKASNLIKDKKDIPFLALALEMSIPIWSNDTDFKQQCTIKIFSTKELKDFLNF